MTASPETPRLLPRPLVRLFWTLHRTTYRATGGRFGLTRPVEGKRFGMMRLHTVGRRSGQERSVIVGYFPDGPNLVSLAEATVDLRDGIRTVRARAAAGAERERLWARFRDFPGWGADLDQLAARRTRETTVVVFEPPCRRRGWTSRGWATWSWSSAWRW